LAVDVVVTGLPRVGVGHQEHPAGAERREEVRDKRLLDVFDQLA
jgi:hypothetical protein